MDRTGIGPPMYSSGFFAPSPTHLPDSAEDIWAEKKLITDDRRTRSTKNFIITTYIHDTSRPKYGRHTHIRICDMPKQYIIVP